MKTTTKAAPPIEIQVAKPVLLNGPVLKFIPAFTCELGGDLHAITFSQISYLSKSMVVNGDDVMGTRISLTRLQREIPFAGRRRLMQVLQALEATEWLKAERTGRVNVYVPLVGQTASLKHVAAHYEPPYQTKLIVLPALAQIIGLKAAIVLQQIHIRLHKGDGSIFYIRSLEDWQSKTFPFWGLATIKRIFSKLRDLNLIVVRPHRREDDGYVNSYRVNYVGLAEFLKIPIPNVNNPYKPDTKDAGNKDWYNWTNPVTLKTQSDMN